LFQGKTEVSVLEAGGPWILVALGTLIQSTKKPIRMVNREKADHSIDLSLPAFCPSVSLKGRMLIVALFLWRRMYQKSTMAEFLATLRYYSEPNTVDSAKA
jgi:hypothetical protein